MRHSIWLAVGPGLLVAMLGCSQSADQSSPSDNGSFVGSGASKGVGTTATGGSGTSLDVGSTIAPGPGSAGTTSATGGAAGVPVAAQQPPNTETAAGGANANPDVTAPALPTNPFVITAHDPLSTFAADVDTASYDIFTSSVTTGSLPAPATVRLEEFVNYFHYGYTPPAADAAQPFTISLAAAPALDPSTLLLRVGIQGRLPSAEKKPANLVFLVDVSGSMAAENKLPLVRYTLNHALAVLDPTDEISIVTYAGATEVRLAPTPVKQANLIEDAIASLQPGGGTNGSSGIKLAYQQAETGFLEGGINHVLLCTDGDFNLGITSPDELVQLITTERESGITFTGLGYGANPNDAMMERVSDAGNGTYSVIYSETSADDYIHERLLSSLEYIAKDMKIQVEFNPDKVYAYRLLGYEDRNIADQDFRNDVVDAGEVGAGHRVTALYQVVLAGQEIPMSSAAPVVEDGALYSGPTEVNAKDYALVKVRYKAPDAQTADPAMEVNQALGPDRVADGWSKLDPDFQWAYAIANFAEILKKSPYAMPGELNTIGNIINQKVHDGAKDREQFRASFALAKPLLQ